MLNELANQIVQGVLHGRLYAMFAVGLSLSVGVMRLVNIAHGDLIVLVCFLLYSTCIALGMPPLYGTFKVKGKSMVRYSLILRLGVAVRVKPSGDAERRRESGGGGRWFDQSMQYDTRRSPLPLAVILWIIAPHPCMQRILPDPDHDAVIRIGSEAPKQQ